MMMWAIVISLMLVLTTTQAKTVDDCVVSDFGEWTPCLASNCDPEAEGLTKVDAESFHMDEIVTEDKGRQMMKIMTAEKIKAFDEQSQCMKNNTCPEVRNGPTAGPSRCLDGLAGKMYPCRHVDLLSYIDLPDLGEKEKWAEDDTNLRGNDVWGWVDSETGDEYALMGMNVGTSFVRVTDPRNPQVLAFIRTRTSSSNWRDIKVINNTAYIVSEASGHGMQVFDLLRLRGKTDFEVVEPDAEYTLFGNAHNIVANEETGFLYGVGSREGGYTNTTCKGGLHIIDARDRLNPKFVGCFGLDGYTHDAQCVVYHGPDVLYKYHEICFCYNEDTLTTIDVTNKDDPKIVSRVGYTTSMYTHQGWVTEDHTMILLDDELDESRNGEGYTLTYIWDVTDLADPILKNTYRSIHQAIDHNQYIREDLAYQSNYEAGLRIMHIDQDHYDLTEVGYFDVYPSSTKASFGGTWSNYPYFPSGTVLVSSIQHGLFMVGPDYEAIRKDIKKHTQYAQQQRMRKVIYASEGAECPNMEEFRECEPVQC